MRKRTVNFGQWKQVGAILVPASIPEKVGLGCPKCDDHETVEFTRMGEAPEQKRIEEFVKKHEPCGELECLEVHGGDTKITGYLREAEN